MTTWVDALKAGAPDIVAAWSGIEEGHQVTVRREVRTRAGEGSAERIVQQLPLDHPLVGQLRCGEWLVFGGVHDLMHLEQLHAIMRA